MKTTLFGTEIVTSRELPPEDDLSVPTEEVDRKLYTKEITRAKKQYKDLAAEIHNSECFAVMWKDESGECPMQECALRHACKDVYTAVNFPSAFHVPLPSLRAVKDTDVPVPSKKLLGFDVTNRNLKPKKPYKKWKGTGKYTRQGYKAQGRPVDVALSHLLKGLGNPPNTDGAHFTKLAELHTKLGPILINQTASYTALIVNSRPILRWWTNAGSCATIDFAPELYNLITASKLFPKTVAIPQTSKKKLAPCEHRAKLTFGSSTYEEQLAFLGAQIHMAFKNP